MKAVNAGGFDVLRKLTDRKHLGVYYTPASVAEIICNWAIDKPKSLVLEPSFGGCELLDQSLLRLRELGCCEPEAQIFGCDIDPNAFEHLEKRPKLFSGNRFVNKSFLELRPEEFSKKFDVVVSNPPYVRYQKLSKVQKRYARDLQQSLLPSLSLQASLWAFFLVHGSQFLVEGGRSVWLLPSSFVYADYAKSIHAFLRSHYESLLVVTLTERLFTKQGAGEGTVILAADGWRRVSFDKLTYVNKAVASSNDDLRSLLTGNHSLSSPHLKKNAYEELKANATLLGDLCLFEIGVVTGNSKFFLFDKHIMSESGVEAADLPLVISKSKHVPGLIVTSRDLQKEFSQGAKVRIFNPRKMLAKAAVSYLARMTPIDIEKNVTFNKRVKWYRPLDGKVAEAFFCGMSHFGPRLVLNGSSASCTNALYRVKFKEGVSKRVQKLIAMLLLSSFSQLSAERTGRAYSAGLLKHEPSDAKKIEILLPITNLHLKRTFDAVDAFLKDGKLLSARDRVDEFLIANGAMTNDECAQIKILLERARVLRMKKPRHS